MTEKDNLIGNVINGYTILRHLERGGMADVYIARHNGLQRDVAMKVLLPTYLDNLTFVERFQREAQAMARLDHGNIVQVYDTGTLPDGRPYFTMQLVPGGTLESRLEKLAAARQMLTVPYALAIARQVAAALQVAHGAGIIHRDLKPSNILLDAQGKPILTDLGIAFVQDDRRLTRTDIFLGTPHYMSPEQAKGLDLDGRSDIYSLGVVLYEMLAGQRPFDGDSHWVLIHQHVSEVAPPLGKIRPGINKATEQVVTRCLEKDRARRFQSATELVAALDNALRVENGAGMLTASGEWAAGTIGTNLLTTDRTGQLRPMPARTSVNKKKTPAWLYAGLAVAGLAVVGWWLLGSAEPPTPPPTVISQTQLATVIVTVVAEVAAQDGAGPTSTVAMVTTAQPAVDEEPATPTRTPTRTPTPTRVPSRTPTRLTPSGQLTATVSRDVWTRAGPGMAYPQGVALVGESRVSILGRDDSRTWYLVRPDGRDPSWVNVDFLRAGSGVLERVQVAATIPSLPPTATFTPVPVTVTQTPVPPGGGGGDGGSQQPEPTPSATPWLPDDDNPYP